MMNLIRNSRWLAGSSGGPLFFSGTETITFDEFTLNGYRSCSITMADGNIAKDAYELFIDVTNVRYIQFGLKIRTTDLTNLSYVMEFYDENKNLIDTQMKNQTSKVGYQFMDVFANFKTPMRAKYAKVYWQFEDKVTACTYLAPQAYIM